MQTERMMPPHLVRKPCRVCSDFIPALVMGRLESHPICQPCRSRLEREWHIANLQRQKQERR
jgi:hypothetical protein